ncbi:histidine phosphatase family protein [Nakamurella sp. YIM 132087]|uniref:Histidine phosphatase family protein n=1 Tax=Nakamurella alba TaxID=2665158 RepID=A0A7K1FTL0_9ACTN|nr:histidine phosphatase family protein [Nakamurella alba]MTD17458.1 histidine phosphatase family protein [Nakamurella alba]
MSTELILSRHGRTVWHAENRYAGSSDVDLDDVGRRQAEQLATWAAAHRPDAFYCSPVRRARETAAPVAAALGAEPVVVDDLREVHFGVAEGLTIGEIREQLPDVARAFESDPVAGAFPEAEPTAGAAARAVAALQGIVAAHPDGRVLVVAHNTLFRLALCSLLGIPLADYRIVLPRLDNGTLTRLRFTGGRAALLSFNVPLP